VTIYGLVMGSFPFDEASQSDFKYRIFNSNQKKFWEIVLESEDSVSEEFKDLMFKMMSEDPNNRLTVDGIIAHPWFLNRWNRHYSISYIDECLYPSN
jgi:serine/threonine protein kinase